jgi:hypothetical protein
LRTSTNTNKSCSSAKHLKGYKAKRCRRVGWHRLLVVAAALVVVVPTMTFKHGLIVYEDETNLMRDEHAYRIPVLRITYTHW